MRDREILKFVSQQLAAAIEHKRYEEALRRSEARSRSLILSAAFGICRCTLGGRFLDVNPALINMLGYASVEAVLQLDVKRDVFVNPLELDRLVEDYRRTGSLNGVEVQWRRKDAGVIIVRLSGGAATITDEPGEVLELIAEDITDRRQLEEQLRQAQKMDAVGRLAGGVAHDFNNLLMVINGYTEVLLEQLEKGSAMHQKVESIQQAADRAATLTRQLLAFSRKQLLELKVVDVNTVIGDMERLLRPLIGENIELVTRLSSDAGHTRADAGQLEQVIMNLVVNAKDSMPEGGKLTVQSSDVTVRPNFREHRFIQPGRYAVISVADTGHGMDKETQSRIFEPFFTTKEKGKGTGLGLSTVYGIVKQSNGYVFVQSELGAGTTFYVYLPRVEDATEELSPAQVPAKRSGRLRNRFAGGRRRIGPRTGARHPRLPRLQRPRSGKRRVRPAHRRVLQRTHPYPDHRCGHARHRRPRIGQAAARAASGHERALSFRLHRRCRRHPGRARPGYRIPAKALYLAESRQESPRSHSLPARPQVQSKIGRELNSPKGFKVSSVFLCALCG